MKGIVETISEAKTVKFSESLTFNSKTDIYNILSQLAFEYDQAGKGSFNDKREIAAALDDFMEKFFDE